MIDTPRLEFIRLAKELTCSDDIQVILKAARELEGYLGDEDIDDAHFTLPDNPISFLETCRIWSPKGLTKLCPFEFQKGWVDWLEGNADFVNQQPEIMLTARQMGTSTILPLYMLYVAARDPWTRIMIVTSKFSMARDLWDRVALAIDGMDMPVSKMNKTKITLENGSEITFASQNDLRQGAASTDYNFTLMMDAACYPYSRDYELKEWTMRAVSGGSRVIIASSARFTKGFLFDLIDTHNVPCVTTHFDQNPNFDQAWVDRTKEMMSEATWLSEYECHFISFDDEEPKSR